MAQERRRRWLVTEVSVAEFQRPEADATNQPIAYQTRPLNWTFDNPTAPSRAGRLATLPLAKLNQGGGWFVKPCMDDSVTLAPDLGKRLPQKHAP